MQVRGLLAHASEQFALEGEELRLADVAVAPAVPDHRIRLDGLERLTSGQVAELVGAEVDRPVHHRPRREGAGDPRERGGHPVDELALAALGEESTGVFACRARRSP